jgi:hypothetical protein
MHRSSSHTTETQILLDIEAFEYDIASESEGEATRLKFSKIAPLA